MKGENQRNKYMLFWLIPLILIGVALVVIVVVLLRKTPQLSVLDVESIEKERFRQTKERLIMGKLERIQAKKFGKVSKVASSAAKNASKFGRRAVQRLYRLEQYYKKLQKSAGDGDHSLSTDAVKRLLDEAEAYVRQDEFIQAEKRYIEIISHNPKSTEAYEGLGQLYLRSKQYTQARESLKFALRLDPKDASVNMSIAELELAEGNHSAAVESLRKCIDLRPKNPKYLDSYIQASLDASLAEDARKGIDLLRQVNPENNKIQEFEDRLEGLSA